ncbi:hypothetical protein tb265_18210 [Gemmatimonadetes bacterium T265]|nr:hypothetical protein tb265_18210 [Gemmatimonadetes bacterium T265]
MGKPKHSNDTRGEQQGAQTQAQGDHGAKTHSAIKAEINNDGRQIETRSQREANDPNRGGKGSGHDAELHNRMIANPSFENDGNHRLFENRTQHDEAEKDSEQNRRNQDVERHDHDRAAIQGHDASERSGHGATVKNTGEGGGNRAKADHGHA